MTDRVYPSAKPAAAGPAVNGGTNPAFPATKAQLYNASRPLYRPQTRRSRRSCCCSCFLWTALVVILVLLLAAVAGAALWVIYRPHRPDFTVSSLQISQFNLTKSSTLNSKFNLTILAKNPNKKLVYIYEPISISIFADGVDAGEGSIPGFVHGTKNSTTLKTTIATSGQSVDSSSEAKLRSNLKSKSSLPLKIQLETKVNVKIGGMKTKKVRVRVICTGIKANLPAGKTATVAKTANAKCKADLRIKIWKWTF